MTRSSAVVILTMSGLLATLAASTGGGVQAAQREAPPAAQVAGQQAVLEKYCVSCHNQRAKIGGLALDGLDISHVDRAAEAWEKVVRKLRSGLMPPAGLPRPETATYHGFQTFIETELDRAAASRPDPGRTPSFHRLNRTEYRNAVRDLLSLDVDVTAMLPVDPASYGFDNIGDALGMSPALLDRYLSAAERIGALAVGDPAVGASLETYVVASDVTQRDRLDGMPFGTRGGTRIAHTFPLDGDYAIQLRLARNFNTRINGLNEPHQIEVTIDGARVGLFTIGGRRRAQAGANDDSTPTNEDDALRLRLHVDAGPRTVAVAFLKRPSVQYEDPRMPLLRDYQGTSDQQNQPALSKVEIEGPFEGTLAEKSPSRARVFTCRPSRTRSEADCAKSILSSIAHRAYRRPLTSADVALLQRFFEEGRAEGGFESGIAEGITRILVSPSFLFRVEQDPAGVVPGRAYRVGDLELASRLSFFLWSSIPDDALLDLAEQGQLRQPGVLRREVRRMIADPKSSALARNFTGQWLDLRKVADSRPTQRLFPDFDGNLRDAFQRETELFIDSVIRDDRSVVDLLGANYTFVNERLARHYGIANVYGPHFRRVTLTDDARGGLLGQGSILTLTSNDIRTSPVRRGVFILERLLGVEPPPPPANVPPLVEDATRAGQVMTMRERMEAHRKNPACASCHAMIDPMGLALESFDAVGRHIDAGAKVDVSGVLPDGTKFSGPAGLRRVLLGRSDEFVMTMTERLFTYALGRGADYHDAPAIRRIARTAAAQDYRFSSVLFGIVDSDQFQMRRSLESTASAAASVAAVP